MRRLLAALVAAAALPPGALASEALSDVSVTNITLEVNASGEALVTYDRENGQPRHVLAWGAVNAFPPSADQPQVRFKWDYAGGWHKYRNGSYWKQFKDA